MKIPLFIVLISVIYAAKEDDLVDHDQLIDYIKVPYSGEMYSGYLAATQDESTQFHYYLLTTIREDKNNAPVILWLNGGPGCSSLQGALNENGPFVFKVNTNQVETNPDGWTNFANMLYLESPARVGYSYGNAEVDDNLVALQNLHALLEFFNRFQEFDGREFYISGESYAGVYIPLLADKIIEHNKSAGAKKINLKGIAVGNGCTHPTECSLASEDWPQHVIDFLGRHGVISEEQYKKFLILQASDRCSDLENLDKACTDFVDELWDYLNAPYNFLFNPYNVYGKCWNQTFNNIDTLLHSKLQAKYGGCNDARGLYAFFRDEKWNTLTHISEKSLVWKKCNNHSSDPEFKYTRLNEQSYYIYQNLIKSGLRIMHFSGDTDSVVPITGTLYWINLIQKELSLATVEKWRPWYVPGVRVGIDKSQNAGNVWTLDGITFVTVRNAGHMVPTDQRRNSLVMIQNFVEGKPLPYKI